MAVRAIAIFARHNDVHHAQMAFGLFAQAYKQSAPEERKKLSAMWAEAGLGPLPEALTDKIETNDGSAGATE